MGCACNPTFYWQVKCTPCSCRVCPRHGAHSTEKYPFLNCFWNVFWKALFSYFVCIKLLYFMTTFELVWTWNKVAVVENAQKRRLYPTFHFTKYSCTVSCLLSSFVNFGDGSWRQAKAWIVLLAVAIEINALAEEALREFTQWLWIEHSNLQFRGGRCTNEVLPPFYQVLRQSHAFLAWVNQSHFLRSLYQLESCKPIFVHCTFHFMQAQI